MERTTVDSSKLIKSYGYDAANETLEIELHSSPGRVYRYKPVSAAEFAEFESAKSKGGHFLKHIKPAKACVRVEEPDGSAEKTSSGAMG